MLGRGPQREPFTCCGVCVEEMCGVSGLRAVRLRRQSGPFLFTYLPNEDMLYEQYHDYLSCAVAICYLVPS